MKRSVAYITLSRYFIFLKAYYRTIILVPLLLGSVFLISKSPSTDVYASSLSFFPTECRGEWNNPNNATTLSDFSEENSFRIDSASVSESVSTIICDGFRGEIPEDRIQNKLILNFSWSIVKNTTEEIFESEMKVLENIEEEIVNDEESISADLENTDETIVVDVPNTEPIIGDENSEIEPILEEAIQADIEDTNKTIVVDVYNELNSSLEVEESSLEEPSIIKNKQQTEEEINEPILEDIENIEVEDIEETLEETLEENEYVETSEEISFFQNILYGIAYAQESFEEIPEEGTQNNEASNTENLEIVVEEVLEIEIIENSLQIDLENSTETIVVDVSEEELINQEFKPEETQEEGEGIIENNIETDELTEEEVIIEEEQIIVNETEEQIDEISSLDQELILSDTLYADIENNDETIVANLLDEETIVSSNDILEIMYSIDGNTWISLGFVSDVNGDDVSFEIPMSIFSTVTDIEKLQISISSLQAHNPELTIYLDALWFEIQIPNELDEPTLPPLQLSKREVKEDIVLDNKALHSCYAEEFSIDISGVKNSSAKILLENNPTDTFELEIGGLPIGIDVTFFANDTYVYQPQTDEREIDLKIFNENNSPKGNFTIPIIYRRLGDIDSSTLCQINIINE